MAGMSCADEIRAGFEKQVMLPTSARYGAGAVDMLMKISMAAPLRMRILGREDRWFARIDIIGPAAANAESGLEIERSSTASPRSREQPRPGALPVHLHPQAPDSHGPRDWVGGLGLISTASTFDAGPRRSISARAARGVTPIHTT